ncbi:MAG: hypothetical protein IT292_10125 [Deltaproteobacteria bacterium]|nr:hypothetical protein [Deltaproteobacteria bacterium]
MALSMFSAASAQTATPAPYVIPNFRACFNTVLTVGSATCSFAVAMCPAYNALLPGRVAFYNGKDVSIVFAKDSDIYFNTTLQTWKVKSYQKSDRGFRDLELDIYMLAYNIST